MSRQKNEAHLLGSENFDVRFLFLNYSPNSVEVIRSR